MPELRRLELAGPMSRLAAQILDILWLLIHNPRRKCWSVARHNHCSIRSECGSKVHIGRLAARCASPAVAVMLPMSDWVGESGGAVPS